MIIGEPYELQIFPENNGMFWENWVEGIIALLKPTLVSYKHDINYLWVTRYIYPVGKKPPGLKHCRIPEKTYTTVEHTRSYRYIILRMEVNKFIRGELHQKILNLVKSIKCIAIPNKWKKWDVMADLGSSRFTSINPDKEKYVSLILQFMDATTWMFVESVDLIDMKLNSNIEVFIDNRWLGEIHHLFCNTTDIELLINLNFHDGMLEILAPCSRFNLPGIYINRNKKIRVKF